MPCVWHSWNGALLLSPPGDFVPPPVYPQGGFSQGDPAAGRKRLTDGSANNKGNSNPVRGVKDNVGIKRRIRDFPS